MNATSSEGKPRPAELVNARFFIMAAWDVAQSHQCIHAHIAYFMNILEFTPARVGECAPRDAGSPRGRRSRRTRPTRPGAIRRLRASHTLKAVRVLATLF